MTRPNESVHKLWEMPPIRFDQWRRENDLPELLGFFKTALPNFEEWQSVHAIDDAAFLTPTGPSNFFLGDKPAFLHSSTGPDEWGAERTTVYFHERRYDEKADQEWQRKMFNQIRFRTNWEIPFTPYFRWLRVAKGVKRFRVAGQPSDFTSDFQYGRTEAYNTIFSRTFLFHSHKVLKLGGVAIEAMRFDERNLDFVDLDHLTVSGRGASRQTSIAYSSCRHLTFKNYNKPFVRFEKCELENPRFENCHLEGFEFVNSSMGRPVFRNARLSRFVLRRSAMGQATFDKCDLVDLRVVETPKNASPDFYKRLRVAFQSQGNREEASRFYYQERLQELRARAWPLMPRLEGLPGFFSVSTLYDSWEKGQMGARKIAECIGKNALSLFMIAIHPRMLFRVLREKLKLIADTVDWLVWGFGERPRRVFYWMCTLIGVFTLKYYIGPNEHLQGDWAASVSCSLYNFATIGCEQRGRFDSVEGIMGAILLGIMVAGFSNRTRY